MILKTLRRHLLPIIITPILLMCGWLVVGSPILLVFILDDAFKISEFVIIIFYIIGICLAICIFFAFPLTLLVEKVFAKSKIAIVLMSGLMFLVSVFILLNYVFNAQSMLELYPWSGILLLFSFSLGVYLLVLLFPYIQKFTSERPVDMSSKVF